MVKTMYITDLICLDKKPTDIYEQHVKQMHCVGRT